MLASYFFELDWRCRPGAGGVLAMSSTAIVSKLLVERAELNTAPWTEDIMGVLLFQDWPWCRCSSSFPRWPAAGSLSATLGWALLKAAVVLAALLVFGHVCRGPWFHLVARQKSSESVMLRVAITLGLAWITGMAGLSLVHWAHRGGHC